MVSSVAIDDDLRRKLKLLAAKYDTTQAEIIRRALEFFEARETVPDNPVSSRVRDALKQASVTAFRTNPRRKRIAEALARPGIDIDDLRLILDV
jgi:hypothetical protein